MVPYLTLPGPMGPSSLQSRSRTHSLATYSWLQTLAWAFLLSGWLVSSGNFPPLSFLCGIRLKPFRGLGNLERGKKSRLPTAFWLPRRRSWSSFLFGTVRSWTRPKSETKKAVPALGTQATGYQATGYLAQRLIHTPQILSLSSGKAGLSRCMSRNVWPPCALNPSFFFPPLETWGVIKAL